jgi:hypothetical protein
MNRLYILCRSDPERIAVEMAAPGRWFRFCLWVILVGAGAYGATIGLWRAPRQGLYTAIKFPLLILLTTGGNSLINGMLAQLLGLGISFRRSALAVLTSFALASVILAALSPITFFMWWNTPPLGSAGDVLLTHNFTLVTHVFIIAFAGVTGNVRLYWLLAHLGGSRAVGRKILLAWLAVNMFLGCQLSWITRPFIGSPRLPVEFLREEAFRGNFYETTFRAFVNLVT